MSTGQIPLVFFKPLPDTDALSAARSVLADPSAASVAKIDPARLLKSLKQKRGFAKLKLATPSFGLDDSKAEAAFEGTASDTHLHVTFYGNFDKVAEPLFNALLAEGLLCYSVWDRQLITEWPAGPEMEVDNGFAARMSRVVERKTNQLREIEPDPKQRTKLLNAFVKSHEFRAEMAREARAEGPRPAGEKTTFSDLVNCYARWQTGHPSAGELATVRKLESKYGLMSIGELRSLIGDEPRLLLLRSVRPKRADALKNAAQAHGLLVDVESP
jgi:hypothetical protein